MVKKNPYSPHLRRKDGVWICAGQGYSQLGTTPQSAYAAWQQGFYNAYNSAYGNPYGHAPADKGVLGRLFGGVF